MMHLCYVGYCVFSLYNTHIWLCWSIFLEQKDDGPGPRCGHTLTAIAPVGEEGSPGYIGPRLILFGGATALEGSSAPAGPPSPAAGGAAGISKWKLRLILSLSLECKEH